MKMAVSNVIQILKNIQYPENHLILLAGHFKNEAKIITLVLIYM